MRASAKSHLPAARRGKDRRLRTACGRRFFDATAGLFILRPAGHDQDPTCGTCRRNAGKVSPRGAGMTMSDLQTDRRPCGARLTVDDPEWCADGRPWVAVCSLPAGHDGEHVDGDEEWCWPLEELTAPPRGGRA